MNILVIGAGAWGTALAISASRSHHSVSLWARDAALVDQMRADGVNSRYLRDVSLPRNLRLLDAVSLPLLQAVAHQDLIILATPISAARQMLTGLRNVTVPIAWLSKGFEAPVARTASVGEDSSDIPPFGLLVHEIRALIAPDLRAGVLSGPSFAQEVASGQPTALVAASEHAEVRDALVAAFHGPTLRIYANDDIVGVEVGGAVKNVLAIATGLCDGLQLGLNARAALITRGLAEMTRLGLALGARAETFTGLSGLGDLVLTSTGDLSRNRKVGLLLAQGNSLEQAVNSLGHVAEGVYCARTVVQRAAGLGIDMPISEAVVALLDGRVQTREAVELLMSRDPAAEHAQR